MILKNAYYFRFFVVAVSLAIVGFRAPAYSQGRILDQAHVPVQIEPQQTQVWCWVASARMVATYFNKAAPPQCEMLHQQYGAPCCLNPPQCTRPGTIWEIQQLIRSFGLRASEIGPPANGYVLLNIFRQGRPIVLHLRQGHFVVAAGITVVADAWGQPLGIVRILDPYFGPYEKSLPELLLDWDAAVYVY